MPFIQRGPTHDIPYLDIRLDDEVSVLRGGSDESSGALLKGLVALCVRETVSVKGIMLVLQGVKRLQWSERALPPVAGLIPTAPRTVRHEEVFYEKKWNFVGDGNSTFAMNPGNYEYPFQQTLEGGTFPEYGRNGAERLMLKARVVRGKFNHDITARKHLRIIRTLTLESLELTQTMSVENVWPNKIEYSISIPTKAVVFGTCIPIDITLVPLLKGLTVGKVICVLKEIHTLSCPQKTSIKQDIRHISSQTFTTGEFEEFSEEELGRWRLHERVTLPKSLNACVQDCDVPSIKIRHKLKFTIQLHNPDGHMSELRASLPVTLFISPNYLMDDSNRIPGGIPAADALEELANAPPRYDEHYLDRLYSGIPQNSFDTPVPSGANTPMALSRNNSVESLTAMTDIEMRLSDLNLRSWDSRSHENSTPSTSVPPTATASNEPQTSDHFSSHHTPNSGPSSRVPSPTPPLEDLLRVPSYSTAVRSGTRNLTDVPLYEEESGVAMTTRSAPVSPQNSPPMEGFLNHPRVIGFGRNRNIEEGGSGMGRRSLSSHHPHSLGGFLDGLRSS